MFKKYNPINNSIKFKDGPEIKWKFKPKLNFKSMWKRGLKRSKLEIEFGQEFTESNVEIKIKVEGEVFKLISRDKEAKFNAEAKATIRL